MERIFHSITYGSLNKLQVFEVIKNEIIKYSEDEFEITVGTDSQTHDQTKIVTVICLYKKGKGGKFFYSSEYVERMRDVRYKIYTEAKKSLDLSKDLVEYLFENNIEQDIVIHLDMGKSKKGKTSDMIKEIIGWIHAEGFNCYFKPDSYAASSIADRISK